MKKLFVRKFVTAKVVNMRTGKSRITRFLILANGFKRPAELVEEQLLHFERVEAIVNL